MASVVGLLEAEELAARERVEVLRAEADRVLSALAEAEEDWEGWVVARQRVDRVLSARADRDGPGQADATQTSPSPVGPVPSAPGPEPAGTDSAEVSARRTVAVWAPGISPGVLREVYRRVVEVLACARTGGSSAVMSCQEIAVALGLEPTKNNVEGRVRHTAKRLAERGWLTEPVPGRFMLAAGPAAGS